MFLYFKVWSHYINMTLFLVKMTEKNAQYLVDLLSVLASWSTSPEFRHLCCKIKAEMT